MPDVVPELVPIIYIHIYIYPQTDRIFVLNNEIRKEFCFCSEQRQNSISLV